MDPTTAIRNYLEANEAIVIATADDTGPHAAMVYYKYTPDLKIRFITLRDTRKSRQMVNNPKVAFVIANKDNVTTLQGQGEVSKILDAKVLRDLFRDLFEEKAQPEHGWATPIEKLNQSSIVAFEINPSYMRLINYGTKEFQPKTFEINFQQQ